MGNAWVYIDHAGTCRITHAHYISLGPEPRSKGVRVVFVSTQARYVRALYLGEQMYAVFEYRNLVRKKCPVSGNDLPFYTLNECMF